MRERTWLREMRDKRQLTQQQVADLIRTTQQHYSLIEKGERRPSPLLAKRIAALFGFDWTVFFDDEAAAEESA
jgi:putative transcriptional regulator